MAFCGDFGGKIRNGPRKGEPCTQTAGWGTDHVGQGPCKLHGGSNPIKHGRYSKFARARLGEELEAIEADPDPLNLRPELDLVRASAVYYLRKNGPTPLVADLAERAVRIADTMRKHEDRKGISLATLQRVVEQLGVAVARHVKDPELLAAIERDWGTIQLGS